MCSSDLAMNLEIDPLLAEKGTRITAAHSLSLQRADGDAGDDVKLQFYSDFDNETGESRRHVEDAIRADDRLQSDAFRRMMFQVGTDQGGANWTSLSRAKPGTNAMLFEASRIHFSDSASDKLSLQFRTTLDYPSGHVRTLKSTFDLSLKAIRQFYDSYQVQFRDAAGRDLRWNTGGPSFSQWAKTGQQTVHGTRAFRDEDYLLFVHGWNMSEFDKRAFAETAFKRLYWQGYHGTVGMLNWPTFRDVGGGLPLPGGMDAMSVLLSTYGASEYVAYRSALALIGIVDDIQKTNPRVSVLAHSMGNVVISESMRLWQLAYPQDRKSTRLNSSH